MCGLESADTYNRVRRIVEAGDSLVVRELIALGPLARRRTPRAVPQEGEPVRIDRDAFPGAPWLSHGIGFPGSRRAGSPGERFPSG